MTALEPPPASLESLAASLREHPNVLEKLRIAAAYSPAVPVSQGVPIGDDTAAIPDGDGYLLFAAEGMWPDLVATEPRFAGYCAVMVNASDVYAMGGRPLAIVDAIFAGSADAAAPLLQGMADGAARFGV